MNEFGCYGGCGRGRMAIVNGERFYGSLDRTQLHVRWVCPFWFRQWNPARGQFCFHWRLLLNPAYWWKAARQRDNWRAWCRFARACNCRCYCPVGWLLQAHVVVCGFGCLVWLSHYGGDVPCWCDKAIDAMQKGTADAE